MSILIDRELIQISKMSKRQFRNWSYLAAQEKINEMLKLRQSPNVKVYWDPKTMSFISSDGTAVESCAASDVLKKENELKKEIYIISITS